MHTLYAMQDSGNCYKLRLVMSQLKIPYRVEDIDILKGENRTPEFLAKNPNGKVPTLELDDGRFITESNAAMFYLAEGSTLLPDDWFVRAQALQWMFFEQYSHEPYVAVARFWRKIMPGGIAEKQHMFPEWLEKGYAAFDVMERHLGSGDYFAGNAYSIADIALYAYTHTADDGGFDLSSYPKISDWLARVAGQPGHVDMAYRP